MTKPSDHGDRSGGLLVGYIGLITVPVALSDHGDRSGGSLIGCGGLIIVPVAFERAN